MTDKHVVQASEGLTDEGSLPVSGHLAYVDGSFVEKFTFRAIQLLPMPSQDVLR